MGMAFMEDCVRLRKVVSDVRHVAFTMGLHRAYRIHVHKLLNSAIVCRTMPLCSLRTSWLKSLTRIEAVKTGSLLLLQRCFQIVARSRTFPPAHSMHGHGYFVNRMASA